MIKVVIFDFDDTLCLTEEVCFNLENKVVVDMGFPPMTREAHKKNWGVLLRDAILERVPGINADEFIKRQEALFFEYITNGNYDQLSEENLETLDTLISNGKKIAIITNRSFAETRHLVQKSHPLSSKVEAFFHRDNSDFTKPDPRVFNQVLKQFNVNPEECVYVGDSLGDGIAANGAGVKFIALLESGLRQREDFKDLNVDFFALKLPDVLKYVDSH
jgi:HAD superfamily hydrolase (TIGR01662 family)